MKLKTWKQLFERIGFEDIDETYDENDFAIDKELSDEEKEILNKYKAGKPEQEEGFYYGEEDEESMYDNDEDDDDDYDDEDDEEGEEAGLIREQEPELDEEQIEAFEHLASTIRAMLKNSGFSDYYVFVEDANLKVQFVLNKRERFSRVVKVLAFLRKLSTDILIQYDSEVELWETRDGEPLLTVDFFYSSGKKGMFNPDDYEGVPF